MNIRECNKGFEEISDFYDSYCFKCDCLFFVVLGWTQMYRMAVKMTGVLPISLRKSGRIRQIHKQNATHLSNLQ